MDQSERLVAPTPPTTPNNNLPLRLAFKKRKTSSLFEPLVFEQALRVPAYGTHIISDFLTEGQVGTYYFSNCIFVARHLQATTFTNSPTEFLDFLFTVASLLFPETAFKERCVFCLRFFAWYVSEPNILHQHLVEPLSQPLREFFTQRMKFKWVAVMGLYLEKLLSKEHLVFNEKNSTVLLNPFLQANEPFAFGKLMQLFVLKCKEGGLQLLPNESCWDFVKFFFFTLEENKI